MMRKSKWFAPYYENAAGDTRAAFSDSWTAKRAGVYFIREKASKKVVYVGMSTSQLKKTIYRHFQVWNDRARIALWGRMKRVSYPKDGYEVRYIRCTADQAMRLEKYYIGKHQPEDNVEKYEEYFKTERAKRGIEDLAYDAEWAPLERRADYIEEEAPF